MDYAGEEQYYTHYENATVMNMVRGLAEVIGLARAATIMAKEVEQRLAKGETVDDKQG